MKRNFTYYLTSVCILLWSLIVQSATAQDTFYLGNGSDGALTVGNGNIVSPSNCVRLTTSATSGQTFVTVPITIAFAVGDLIMILQTSGLTGQTSGNQSAIALNGNVGQFELKRVTALTSTRLTFAGSPLANSYAAANTQIVLVREYTSVNVQAGGMLIPAQFDGLAGGVTAFLATGTVTIDGMVGTAGKGPVGGVYEQSTTNSYSSINSSTSLNGGKKGYGIALLTTSAISYAYGNQANGGGGGNGNKGGGGGGANAGNGGAGGLTSGDGSNEAYGGLGGAALAYSPISRLVFGGSGGAGHGNGIANNSNGNGGAGGGVVWIRANAIAGTGMLLADGASAPLTMISAGAGGGGAGGTICVRAASTIASSLVIRAKGGDGGVNASSNVAPGGGGGGGRIYVQAAGYSGTPSVNGGIAGNDGNNSLFGAGGGYVGEITINTNGFASPITPAITSPTAGATVNNTKPAISGNATAGSTVSIYIDNVLNGTTTADGSGNFTYTPNAALGITTHTIAAEAELLGAASARSTSFNITVVNLPTAPTDIQLSATTVSETVAAGAVIAILSSTDGNTGDTFTYSLVSGTGDTDNAAFTIVGNGLNINASPDFETKNSYSIRIRTTDSGNLTFEKTFTISITNIVETPTTITFAPPTFPEKISSGTVVATLNVDGDFDPGRSFFLTLGGAGSDDNNLFAIRDEENGTFKLLWVGGVPPDFEGQHGPTYKVRIIYNANSSTIQQPLTLTLTNINEAPTDLALSANSINENVAAGSAVGTFSTTDPDAGDTFNYSLVGGNPDNAAFSITGNTLKLIGSPDYETKNTYSIRMRTTDAGGLNFEKELVVTINDLPEPTITIGGTLSNFIAAQGNTSVVQSFSLSGTGMTEAILVTPPSGFEVSKDNLTFSPTVSVGAAGTIASTNIYIRLSATAAIGSYSGNIQISSASAETRLLGITGAVGLGRIYVTTLGAGTKDGSSWANATDDLRGALTSSSQGGEVWVAKGTYKPTSTTNRAIYFSIPNGVSMYGGFAGTETAVGQRNIRSNPTILSGDIGIPGNNTDNSYHLFYLANNTLPTILDGFTITDGSDIGVTSGFNTAGAGLYLFNVRNMTLKNLIITKNTASNEGGGVYLEFSSAGNNTINFSQVSFIQNKGLNLGGGGLNIAGSQAGTVNLDRCIFDGNSVLSTNGDVGTGGGIQTQANNVVITVTNCLFLNNNAGGKIDDGGGAIMNYGGTVNVINSTLYNNVTGSTSFPNGNSLSNVSPGVTNIINSVVWGTAAKHVNKPSGTLNLTNSLIKGETVSPPNLNSDPLFVNVNSLVGTDGLLGTADDGLSLRYSSPARDAGAANNSPSIDLAGTSRPVGAAVDMGAYETTAAQPVVSSTAPNGLSAVYGSVPIAGSFTVSGAGMDAGILVTAPTNFEVSLSLSTGYADAITLGAIDNIQSTVYVRLKSNLPADTYSGNVVLTSLSAATVNVAVTCTVSKAELVITAKNVNKLYGTALTTVTGSTDFTSSGLQNNETIGTVGIAYGDGADALGTVGTHIGAVMPSNAVGGTFNPANYQITYAPGNIEIAAPLIAVGPASLPSATVAAPYNTTLAATGGIGAYTFNVTTGTLPAGVLLATDGTFSGNPTAGGSFTFTVTATDGSLGGPYSGSKSYTLTVNTPTILISNTSLPVGTVGAVYGETIVASGGTAPYRYLLTAGALPPGLTLAADGTLSGTPIAAGTYNCTISAIDSSTGTGAPYSAARAFSLTIAPPTIQITNLTLATGTVGEAYAQTLTAAGGTPTYTFTVTAGALPIGLNLAANGVIGGTPTMKGTFNFTITAKDASGSGPYSGSRAYALSIGAGSQVITFNPVTDQTYGASPITLTAVSSAGLAVTFSSSNTDVATVSNNLLTIVGAGSTTITASQSGNEDYSSAPVVTQTLNVGKASQNITFTALADKTFADAAFDLTATGGASDNAITYTSSNTNVATIIGNKVTIVGAGTTTIKASQAGNANYNAATDVEQTLNIAKASQSITFTALADKTFGDAAFDLTATGGASGNAITYTSSNTNVVTINGNKVTIVGAGATTIKASQAGNANYNAATDVEQTLNVGKASQNITFTALADRTFGDAAFDLTATGGASGNAVTYTSSNPAVTTVNGNKITILGAGTTMIKASQAGNANYSAAMDVEQTLNIAKASQSITFTTLTDRTYGDAAFELTATGGASGNAITYTSSNTNVATIIGNKVTIVGAGTTTIKALQAGNANYSAATDVEQTLNIAKASQSMTFTALADRTFGDAAFDLTATGGASGNPITYTSSNTNVATINGNKVTFVGAGTTMIKASQAGNANYNAATDVEQTLNIAKASQSITFTALADRTFGDAAFDLTAMGGASGNAVTYVSSNPSVATINASKVTIVGAGTTTIKASQAGNANYNAATEVEQTLNVDKASQNITFTALADRTFGDAAFDLTATGGASGNAVTYTSSNPAVATITGNKITIVGAGTTAIKASQAGNVNYSAASDVEQTLNVGKASQTLVFTALADRTYGDAAFDLTATGGASSHAVTYTSSNPSVATINGSKVTIVGAGTTTIKASQAGSANYSAAMDVEQTLNIAKASQSITFTALADRTFGDAAFDLTATGGASGNAVTYVSSNPSVATITGSKVTIVGAGATAIKASQAGNANYSAATDVEQPLNVGKASQNITFTALADRTFGDAAFDLTATGGASGNAVIYTSSNSAVATVNGNKVTIVGAGTTTIKASQAGNVNYSAATDVEQALNIAKASQSITFTALADKTFGDAAFDLDATGVASGNAVTYTSSNTNVVTIIGNRLTILGAGATTIKASQAGNANYSAAMDVEQTLNIAKASQSITFTALANKIFGDAAFDLTATGGASGNAVTYVSSNPSVATINGNKVTIVGAGTTTIKASQAGNANYSAATDVEQTLNIAKASQSMTFTALADRTFGDAAFDLTATGGASGNPITYTSSNTNVATINGNKVTFVGAGTTMIKASQAGNANYNAATDVEQTLNIAKASQTLVFTALADKMFGDAAFDLTATGGASSNAVTYTSSNPSVATITGNKITIVGAGTTTIKASQAGNVNYNAASDVEQTLNVGKALQTLVFTALADKTFGDAAFDLTATGGASGNAVTYTSSNTNVATIIGNRLTILGAGATTIKASQAGSANYSAAMDVEQTLNIAKASQSITFTTLADRTYGDAAFDLAATGGASGNPITYVSSNTSVATINGNKVTIVGAGTTVIKASQAGNANYNAAMDVEQILNIGKASQLIAFGPINNKTYGDAGLTLNAVTNMGNTIAYQSSSPAVASITGNTITITGTGTVTITATQLGNTNYFAAAQVQQTFTVSPKTVSGAFTVANKVYDGNVAATIANSTLSGILAADLADVTLSGGTATFNDKNVGTNKTVSATGFVLAGAKKDRYTLAASNISSIGTITAKSLVITAEDQQKLQGLPLPNFTATYTGFIPGESSANLSQQPNFTTTATTTSPEGTYPIVPNGATAPNYSISYVNGTLTVKPGYPTGIALTAQTLLENAASGALAGTLSGTAADPNTTFTYSMVSGSGDTDNSQFTISGNQVRTTASLNYEAKANYNIRVRATTQYGLTLDQSFTIALTDVNEVPTLNAIDNQAICYTSAQQTIVLSGITAGPEANQTVSATVSSTNSALFRNLSVTQVAGGTAQLRYTPASGANGTATVTITVKDDGGVNNGGTDTFTRTFVLTVNALPVPVISSSIASATISKGATVLLTATGGTSYQWSNANGVISGQNSAILTVRPSETTTYRVVVTNAAGCQESSAYTITVNSDFELVAGTNILSPNGDGKNDKLIIRNLDLYPNNEVRIFDRAGRLLYGKKNYNNEWDGTFNGLPLAEGTYYYVVDFGPGIAPKKGFISIIRD